jgi:hypothetical protein
MMVGIWEESAMKLIFAFISVFFGSQLLSMSLAPSPQAIPYQQQLGQAQAVKLTDLQQFAQKGLPLPPDQLIYLLAGGLFTLLSGFMTLSVFIKLLTNNRKNEQLFVDDQQSQRWQTLPTTPELTVQ